QRRRLAQGLHYREDRLRHGEPERDEEQPDGLGRTTKQRRRDPQQRYVDRVGPEPDDRLRQGRRSRRFEQSEHDDRKERCEQPPGPPPLAPREPRQNGGVDPDREEVLE